MVYIGALIFVLMVLQHMHITNPNRGAENFHRAWRQYRSHIKCCHIVATVGVGATLLFLVAEYYVKATSEDPSKVASMIKDRLLAVLAVDEYISLVLLTLFLAGIKLLIDRFLEHRLRSRNPDVKDPWLQDIWLMWFLASTAASVALGNVPMPQFEPESQSLLGYLAALSVVVVVMATYVFWIHNVLYRQLTLGDGFRGETIPSLLSSFSPLDDHPPAQVLVIGPKGAGKTKLVSSCDPAYEMRLERRKEKMATQVVEVASMIEKVQVPSAVDGRSEEEEIRFSLLDFPGENIGDHCTLPFDLRSDVLVLVMSEAVFNPKLDREDFKVDIPQGELLAENIDRYFGLPHVGRWSAIRQTVHGAACNQVA